MNTFGSHSKYYSYNKVESGGGYEIPKNTFYGDDDEENFIMPQIIQFLFFLQTLYANSSSIYNFQKIFDF